MKRVGVLSDTHGLLRPEALDALKGSDLIMHAGDIGSEAIIPALEKIAPVKAIRGNVDNGAWARRFPLTEALELAGVALYSYHGHLELELDPAAGGFDVVIQGHSHKPFIKTEKDVLYLNPGSAGRKRFSLPVSLAKLTLRDGQAEAELIYLEV